MESGQPSRTAFSAARYRAAHQLIEGGGIFSDPLAVRILGVPPDAEQAPDRRGLRLFIAARTRFAEDALAVAVKNGTRQLVVLGAGLGVGLSGSNALADSSPGATTAETAAATTTTVHSAPTERSKLPLINTKYEPAAKITSGAERFR